MPKTKKTNKKIEKENKIKRVEERDVGVEVEEDLPEDVQEALGIKKQPKVKIKEVDYISELENGYDFDFEDNPAKHDFDDDFDSDME